MCNVIWYVKSDKTTISIKYQYITEFREERQTLKLKKVFNSAEIEKETEEGLWGD